MGVWVLAAVSYDNDGKQLAVGFAAHSSAERAAVHAVGELAQCEINLAIMEKLVARRGESSLAPDAKALLAWRRSSSIAEHPQLARGPFISRELPAKTIDLATCHHICRSRNLDFFVLDLTRPAVAMGELPT